MLEKLFLQGASHVPTSFPGSLSRGRERETLETRLLEVAHVPSQNLFRRRLIRQFQPEVQLSQKAFLTNIEYTENCVTTGKLKDSHGSSGFRFVVRLNCCWSSRSIQTSTALRSSEVPSSKLSMQRRP